MRKSVGNMFRKMLIAVGLCFAVPIMTQAAATENTAAPQSTETPQGTTMAAEEKLQIDRNNFPGLYRELKAEKYDKNQDGYLDSWECDSIFDINAKQDVSSLAGIEHFKNLSWVYLSNYIGTRVTVTEANEKLQSLCIASQKTKLAVDAPYLKQLRVQVITINAENKVSMSNYVGLKKLRSLDVTRCRNLKVLNVIAENLTTLKFSKNNAKIQVMDIEKTKLRKIDMSRLPKLAMLCLADNGKLTSIHLKKNTNLRSLELYRHKRLKSVDLSKCKKLKIAYFYQNTYDIKNNSKFPKGRKVKFPSNNIGARKIEAKFSKI